MIGSGWKAGRLGWVLAGLLCALVFRAMPLRAQVLTFELGGQAVSLEKAPASAGAYLRAFRLNRATGRWDVDVVVTNGSDRVLRGPLVLRFDVARGVAPGIAGATVDAAGQPFLDLTSRLGGGELAPGSALPAFTLSLGDGQARPTLAPALYSRPAVVGPGLVLLRTLGADGVPLEGVEIEELGVSPSRRFRSGRGGWTSLETSAGVTGWRLTAAGRIPVVRLVPPGLGGGVAEVGSARLVSVDGSGVTVLGLQALPAPLPRGWSPLAAVVRGAGVAEAPVDVAEPVGVGGTAVLVRWEDAALAWRCVRLVTGDGGRTIPVSGEGIFAVVRADVAPVSPPAAVAGELLVGVPVAVGGAGLTATGRVDPSSRAASVDAALVTAEATVEFVSGAGRLTSGLVVPAEVTEEYRLRDGSRRILPSYGLTLTAYQRPGGAEASALVARFPLRPMQLLAGEELEEAVVRVAVLAPGEFGGVRMNAAGGVIEVGGVRLEAEAGVLGRSEAVVLRRLAPAGFVGALPAGLEAVDGFEVGVGLAEAGRSFRVRRAGLAAGSEFVLARAIHDSGRHGFLPVERMRTDGAGVLGTVEPVGGDRLPGVDGGGQYWLFRVGAAQSLVTGVVRGAGGQAVAGATVRLGPWTAFAEASGRYRLLAPEGAALLGVLDPATGDSGGASVAVGAGAGVVTADLGTSAQGPRVVATSPADGAREVARVSPVSLEFSRALDPATVTGDSVRLLASDGAVIPASVSVGGTRRTVTLLPSVLMPPDAALRVELAPTIADSTGRALEGVRQLGFRTVGESLIRADATLVIHEPASGVAPMVGGPGLAEPESPVILVNETTGRTSTVLSRPDGSFSNNIPADVEDFLSAVIVNRNGSRNVVPASRQLFRDGRVGLYAGGGVVELAPGGARLVIPPGAIPGRTVFRVKEVPAAELSELAAAVPPVGARVLAGLQMETRGDRLTVPVQVSVPVDRSAVPVVGGATAEDMAFAVVQGVELPEGVVYEVLDTASFRSGRLESDGAIPGLIRFPGFGGTDAGAGGSPRRGAQPALGGALPIYHVLFMGMAEVLRAQYSVVNGTVKSVERDSAGGVVVGSQEPVAGAAVRVGGVSTPTTIAPGDFVAISTANGSYSVPGNVGLAAGVTVIGSATSQRFPGQVAITRSTYLSDQQRIPIELRFHRGEDGVAALDRERPTLRVSHVPIEPTTNRAATLRVLANDDLRLAGVQVQVKSVTSLLPGQAVGVSDVELAEDAGGVVAIQSIRKTYSVRSSKRLLARLEIVATDAAGKIETAGHAIAFDLEPEPPSGGPDVVGPVVVGAEPFQDADGVMPGTRIRIRFSEPVQPSFLNSPEAAFQLQPAAGASSARLLGDGREVELSWYRLQPATSYRVTVLPAVRDLAGNPFDQNPHNGPATATGGGLDSFVLRFTTAPMTPVALPGMIQGAGIVEAGRFHVAADRVNSRQGFLRVYDLADPEHPEAVSESVIPAFPRAMTVVPDYAFRRREGGAVERSDLVVVAGGLLGGSGQWLRVFSLSPDGVLAPVVSTTLSFSPAAAVGRFQWSPPVLGYLESDADTTMVGLINLQLAIVAEHQTEAERATNPVAGAPGKDLNGDGDYVDAGESLPLPIGGVPRLGVINGGLLQSFVPADGRYRLRDFHVGFGGNFVAAVASAPPGEASSRYITFVSGGQAPPDGQGILDLAGDSKRMTILFGQELETVGGLTSGNVALISQPGDGANPARVAVLDLTDPLAPVRVNEIRIPVDHGIPQSFLMRGDGLLALATTEDQLLLEPRKVRLLPPTFADPAPALAGWIPGLGTGNTAFASSGRGTAAVASGGRNRVAGLPGKVSLSIHRPGSMALPGKRVARSLQTDPSNLLLTVNEDNDDGVTPAPPAAPQSYRDGDDASAGIHDDDLALIRLRRLPATVGGAVAGRVIVEIVPSAGSVAPVRVFSGLGQPSAAFAPSTANPAVLRAEAVLPDPASPLDALRTGDLDLFVEGREPCAEVLVRIQFFGPGGASVGVDEARFRVLRLRIAHVWSDQFPDRRVNRLPDLKGDNSDPFLIMGVRADGSVRMKADFVVEPAGVSLAYEPLLRAIVPDPAQGGAQRMRLMGEGTTSGGVASVALDSRIERDHLLAAGFDQDGDGVLSVREASVLYTRAGATFRVGDELRFPFAPGLAFSSDFHVKAFNAVDYGLQQAKYATIANLGSVAFNLWAPKVLAAFAQGTPLQVPVRRPGLGVMAARRVEDEVLEPNRAAYSHNVGVTWDADGLARIPHYILDELTDMPTQILGSPVFQSNIRGFLRREAEAIRRKFRETGANEIVHTAHLHTDIQFSEYSNFCITAPGEFNSVEAMLNGYLDSVLGCSDFDLFTGIGGATIILDVSARFVKEIDPASGRIQYRQDGGFGPFGGVHVKGHLYDLYDWNYKEHWPDDELALIQAGFGTLGTGGRVFSYKILLDDGIGNLDVVIPE